MPEEKNIVHLNIYGKVAFDILKYFEHLGWYARHCRNMNWSAFVKAANGEIIYDSTLCYYSRDFSDSRDVTAFKRSLGSLILKCTKILAHRLFDEDLDSVSQFRESKNSDTPFKDGSQFLQEKNITLNDIALLIELLQGYKTWQNAQKSYKKVVISRVIGEAADPFTSAAAEVLLKQLDEFRIAKSKEIAAMNERHRNEKLELTSSWDAKINAINQQVDELRKATV